MFSSFQCTDPIYIFTNTSLKMNYYYYLVNISGQAHRRLRQEDSEFQAGLSYIMRPIQNKTTTTTTKTLSITP